MKKILLYLIAILTPFIFISGASAEVNLTTGKTQVIFKYKFADQAYSDLKTTFFKTGTAGESYFLKTDYVVSFSDNSSTTSDYSGITLYGRYALCMDGGFTAGWNQSNADDVWFRKTSIPCNYYGSSYTGGTITFATFKMTGFSREYTAANGNGSYQYSGSTEIGTYLTTNNSINFLGFDISNTPFPVYSTEDYLIKQNDQILTTYNTQIEKQDEIKQEQEKTNQELGELNDNITNSDVDDSSASGFFNNFENNDHGLSGIITAPLNFIKNLNSKTCTPVNVSIPLLDSNFSLPCMSTMYNTHFPELFRIYQIVMFGLIAYRICLDIFRMVKGFKDPDSDKVEVIDL